MTRDLTSNNTNSQHQSTARGPDRQDGEPEIACASEITNKSNKRLMPLHLDTLADVISREIVPALFLEFKRSSTVRPQRTLSFSDLDRAEYLSSVMALPPRALTVLTEHFLDTGFTTEQVLLDLLAPSARKLGVMWERDDVGFVEVTIAVQKLQHVLNNLCDSNKMGHTNVGRMRPTAFFVPAPGEAHTFGLVMMSEMLRRRGWDVFGGLPMPLKTIVEMVAARPYALVGFSMSADTLLKPTAAAIRRVRKESANKSVKVLVGGPICGGKPDFAAKLGADGAFNDAKDACDYADKLIADGSTNYSSA